MYWTGPSIGFDAGANAPPTPSWLVYNLYDSGDLFKRFPGRRGAGLFRRRVARQATCAGGDVVLDPDPHGRRPAGWGSMRDNMKFSKKQRWLPF